jgi:predicted peroxiredoxin
MEKIKIIIRDDSFIRMLAPLSFAFDYSNKGKQVDLLFLNLALLALTPDGLKALGVDGRHADKEPAIKEQLANLGLPPDIHKFLKLIKQSGKVMINGCRDSAAVLAIDESNLIEEADGLIDSSKFIEDAIDEGIHCMYF